jgi:hypothetical protein
MKPHLKLSKGGCRNCRRTHKHEELGSRHSVGLQRPWNDPALQNMSGDGIASTHVCILKKKDRQCMAAPHQHHHHLLPPARNNNRHL